MRFSIRAVLLILPYIILTFVILAQYTAVAEAKVVATHSIQLPTINEVISTRRALILCRYFGLDYLVQRIEKQPELYQAWVFDGASMLPDQFVAEQLNIPHLTEIALRHDLKYAYGDPGNDAERLKADQDLREELIADGASAGMAAIFYISVRIGGGSWTHSDFSWGFARKQGE